MRTGAKEDSTGAKEEHNGNISSDDSVSGAPRTWTAPWMTFLLVKEKVQPSLGDVKGKLQ